MLFASIVVAAIGGEPTWTTIGTRFGEVFGELSFQVDPRYYALDGQHRLRAIQELMSDLTGAPPGFDQEELSVLVVVREDQEVDDAVWLQRYRRLFSSLNRYARPTNLDTNIIMDEDDLFAIVTRRLITDHDFFRSPGADRDSFRVLTKGKALKTGASYFTSLQTLYAMNRVLLMSTGMRQRWGGARELRTFLQFRPDEAEIDRYYGFASSVWNALLDAVPDLRENPELMRCHDVPEADADEYQDHLLFWPIGQEILADVARSLMDELGLDEDADVASMTKALAPLGDVNWDMHDLPWRYLLLVPASPEEDSWRVRSEERKAAIETGTELLRWIVGLASLDDGDAEVLRANWRRLLYPEPTDGAHVDAMWSEILALRKS